MTPVLFVWIPKNAGSSIYYSLERAATRSCSVKSCCHKDYVDRIRGATISTFTHMSPSALIEEGYIDRSFIDSRFTFAFTRNPWARLVSYFHYARSLPKMARVAARHCSTFLAMVDSITSGDIPPIGTKNWEGLSQANRQTDWLEIDGKLFPDFIGRVESIQDDWVRLCERLGVKAELLHRNKTDHGDYRDYYDNSLRRRVGKFYEKDCDTFGYAFNGDAK